MKYISAEQFLGQPKEVQKVLMDWFNINISNYDLVQEKNTTMLYKDYLKRIYTESDSYPLFTEGQLREFIEDKTKSKVVLTLHPLVLDYIWEESDSRVYLHSGTDDMLQAYWKVACIMAKEESKCK